MGPVAQRVFKTRAVVQPTARSVRLRRRSVDSRYLQSLVPGLSEKVPPPPTVTGVFHGKQPSFCAVPATRRMSANTPAIASAIKNFLMPGL